MEMDFISFYKRSAYRNIYIYQLIDYFSRHMYPHRTAGAGTDNVIFLFDDYLRAKPKPYAIYMNASLHFTSQKLLTDFQKKILQLSLLFPHFISQLVLLKSQMTSYNKRLKKCKILEKSGKAPCFEPHVKSIFE